MKRRQFLQSGAKALMAANMGPFILTGKASLFSGASSHIISVVDHLASSLQTIPGSQSPNRDGVVLNKVVDYTVNRVRVSNMVDTAVKKLTGKENVGKAWESLFPAGHPNKDTTISVKLNFSYGEGPEINDWSDTICPYGPKVALTDAIVAGLTQMLDGTFPIENILLYDAIYLSDDRMKYTLRQGYRPVIRNDMGIRKDLARGTYGLHWVAARNGKEIPADAPQFLAAPDFPEKYQAPQRIIPAVYENDFMINVANAKTHRASGVTGVMKNTYGCTDNPVATHGNTEWRDALSSPFAGTRKCIPVFYKAIQEQTPCILNVMDALAGVYHGGPLSGQVFGENALAVSRDPVALDSYALALINKHRKQNNYSVLNTTEEGRPADGYPNAHAPFLRYAAEIHNLGSPSMDGLEVIDRTSSTEEYNVPQLDINQARISDVVRDKAGSRLDLFFDNSKRQHTIESRVEDLEGNLVWSDKTRSTRSSTYSLSWDQQNEYKREVKKDWYIWNITVDGRRYSRVIHEKEIGSNG
ncbi:MAG: DUF362 domain-containing protein [Cyclobacteriaceae bacterium]|nr:DUF362 domain-containing protein [Cyclobacteriaceae bacterium]